MQTISTVFLFQFSQVEAATCKYNVYILESEAGKYTCLICQTCPYAFVLFRFHNAYVAQESKTTR